MPGSLIEVRPRHLIVSAIKKAEARDSMILRFYNPFSSAEKAQIYVSSLIQFNSVYLCKINEERIEQDALPFAKNDDGSFLIKLNAAPKKIVTLEFK